jgi:hypothetical protein
VIEAQLPLLAASEYELHSPQDLSYNCIGFSIGDTEHYWWPGGKSGSFWPTAATGPSFREFERVFADLGYTPCAHDQHEAGVEQIALYLDDQDVPQHAAKLREDGRWWSKLGDLEDIIHDDVRGVCCPTYGETIVYFCGTPPPPIGNPRPAK